MAHLRAVPDPDDVPEDVAEVDRVVEPVDPAAATAPGEDDPPHEDVHDEAFEEQTRRYPSTIGGAFYLSILAVAGTARDLAAQQLTQARDRFAAGVASNIEVVQAQDAVAVASEQFIAAQYGYDLAKAGLSRGIGTAEQLLRQLLGGPR